MAFCEIFPPDDFPLYFYGREPKAPDMEIRADELDFDAIRAARVFWVTVTGLSEEPSRAATLAALEARGSPAITVLDLDYRPMFWESREVARESYGRALEHVDGRGRQPRRDRTPRSAAREPRAAARRCRRGLELAVVKQGPEGVLARRRRRAASRCRRCRSRSSTASAPATRSAARCATGCCAGWDLERLMRFCNAAGALVASRLACADAMPDQSEVEALLEEAVGG